MINHSNDDLTFLPPHEPTPVPGFHAYSRQLRVRPGEKLELCISNDGFVDIELLRLGATTRDVKPVGKISHIDATPQTIARGSYVYIADGLSKTKAFTVETWCRTLADAPRNGLVAQDGLFTLWLDAGNVPCFSIGSRALIVRGAALPLKEWHHLAGVWNGVGLSLYVDGEKVAETSGAGIKLSWDQAIRLGAITNAAGEASGFYTGDVWAPSVYERALTGPEITARADAKSFEFGADAAGSWRFDSVEGKPYRDVSGNERHGRPVNYPLRMIPGPGRTEDSDWCTYDPTQDPDFGYAVRFMADQFLDCRWPVTTSWKVPVDIEPGQYAARLTNKEGVERDVYFLIVPAAPRARLLCLSTTSTRVAYNFQPFDDTELDYGPYQVHPSYPMLGHLMGSRRPNSAEPWQRQTIDFELPFYAWLDREGIEYDLYSEWDLEAEPSLLDGYDAVAWAGHSEYWTAQQYQSFQAFLKRGGHVISLAGNTAYWRVSVDLENSVMEVRKHARETTPGTTCDPMFNAAHHHQMDLLPGSTMREAGFPEHRLLCNVSNGYTDPPLNGPRFGYEVLAPSHTLFQSPRAIETAGNFAPDAAGYETDVSSRSMLQRYGPIQLPMYPPRDGAGHPRLEDNFDEGVTVLARSKLSPAGIIDYDNRFVPGQEMWSEMLVWERPGMGLVFSTGSVWSSDSLLTDENFSDFMKNVFEFLGLET